MAKITNKKKMSKPALAATIVSIVILLGLVVSLLAGSGFFFRSQDGASSDNFEINASMLEYYSQSVYQNWYNNWYSQYYYYILYGLQSYLDFNPELPLNEQTESETGKTYDVYFADLTKQTVETYLKYCEAAKADASVDFNGLKKDAKQYVKEQVKSIRESAKSEGVDATTLIRSQYGEHVSLSDIKKALELQHIASSYYDIMYERIYDGINPEREDKFFKENLEGFVTAKYLVYTLSSAKTVEFPNAEDYVGGKDSAAYKKAIEGLSAEKAAAIKVEDYEGGTESAAYKTALKTAEDNKKANEATIASDKAIIEKLNSATTVEEFKKLLLEEKFDTTFSTTHNSATSGFDAINKPSNDFLKIYKTDALVAAIIDAALNDKDDVDDNLVDTDAIKKAYLEDRYLAHLENVYKAAITGFTDEEKPSDDAAKAFKTEELKKAVIDAVLNGKETVDESLVVIAEGSSEKWAEAAKKLPASLIESLKKGMTKWTDAAKTLPESVVTALENVISTATKSATYTLASELGNKLFGGVKAQYGVDYESYETKGTSAAVGDHWMRNVLEMNVENIKLTQTITNGKIADLETEIAAETDAEKKMDLEDEKKALEKSLDELAKDLETAEAKLANVEKTSEYSYSVYFVTEAAHRDEYKTRDVSHILFKVDDTKATDAGVSYKTFEEAEAAAKILLEQIKAESSLTKEKFEEFGKVTHDSNVSYEDVAKGDMVEEFEDWLFAAETVGEVGLVKTTYGWHIMYYGGEAEKDLWRTSAQANAAYEDLDTWFNELPYEITVNEEIIRNVYGVSASHDPHAGHNH